MNLPLREDIEATFATYEILPRRIIWHFVHVVSPTASILQGAVLSVEFRQALNQVESWRDQISGIESLSSTCPGFSDLEPSFLFRILIGQSSLQSAEERNEIQRYRRGDLRIRSYDWLLEKPTNYSHSEIAILEEFGHAKSSHSA